MERDFNEWLKGFRSSIAGYRHYADFPKAYRNVDKIKVQLNILNSLVGSKDIENDFVSLLNEYPKVLGCIPILIAKREHDILVVERRGTLIYNFKKMNYGIDDYVYFMRETGLFELLQERIINNLVDYVTGVEIGMDTNGRKNRGGHEMEALVEEYIKAEGLVRNKDYFKEIYSYDVEKRWGIDLSALTFNGNTSKRFDFVVKTPKVVFAIETNFYSSNGSKLYETSRSYKTLAIEARDIKNFAFVWITDGQGWDEAKKNLEETFAVLPTLYNIKDLEEGVLRKLINAGN